MSLEGASALLAAVTQSRARVNYELTRRIGEDGNSGNASGGEGVVLLQREGSLRVQ